MAIGSEVRAKYGGRLDEALRRAIRAEIDGGDACLDAMTAAHSLARNFRFGTPQKEDAEIALSALRRIANRMEDEVRRRYNMPPRPERTS
jgi:hypothetical protein